MESGDRVRTDSGLLFVYCRGQMELISETYEKQSPNNCPINERTADGDFVGICGYYLDDGVCPRHGQVKPKSNNTVTLL